jgi:hypothetical protein
VVVGSVMYVEVRELPGKPLTFSITSEVPPSTGILISLPDFAWLEDRVQAK